MSRTEQRDCAMPALTAVIPSLNRRPVLRRTVEALLAQQYAEFEIIVVDQTPGGPDDELKRLATAAQRVRYYQLPPCGSPAARNFGISRATGEIVLSCDDDIVPHPGLLAAHARHYADAAICAVAGRVLTREDCPISDDAPIGRFNRFTGASISNFHSQRQTEVHHGQGSNLSARTVALREAGGFDLAFSNTAYWEETDVCLRLTARGDRIVFAPDACVDHLQYGEGGNRSRDFRKRTRWHFYNYSILFMRHGYAVALPLFLGYQMLRATGYAVRERDARLLPIGMRGLFCGLTYALRHRGGVPPLPFVADE